MCRLNAEIIADKSYAIAVDGENIDLDGTNNVVVYLKYTNSGEINASNINLTFQLDGSTENLLEAGAYTWDVEYHDAVMQNMFLERPLAEPSYTHSFDITPNRDAQGNLIPSVKSATVRVYYAGTLLANKTFYIITPITMNGFVTGYDSINSKFLLLKRVDDDTDIDNDNSNGEQRVDSLGREIETSVTLDISTTEDVVWYYRPRTSEDDNDWKEIKASDNFVDIAYDDATINHWLKTFCRRFFNQQFKRSCMPDGPKVGSVCLSPRGDWRMPSDASSRSWQNQCAK